MSEMLSRVTQAIKAEIGRQQNVSQLFEETGALNLEAISRVAIEAIREPTDDMKDAGDALLYDTVECAHNVWHNMIDAALGKE